MAGSSSPAGDNDRRADVRSAAKRVEVVTRELASTITSVALSEGASPQRQAQALDKNRLRRAPRPIEMTFNLLIGNEFTQMADANWRRRANAAMCQATAP
jgi:hypothetical protein